MTKTSKSIWLVEDDQVFAESLIYILDNISDLRITRHFCSAEELHDYLTSPAFARVPDLVLMDIRLPGQSGIEALPFVMRHLPNTPAVMMTMHEDRRSIFDAMQAGALGYIVKGDPYDKVLDVIRAAIDGMLLMSGPVRSRFLSQIKRNKVQEKFDLTKRQKEVLALMCEGMNKAEIADQLSITHATADNHFRHIYQKLNVNSAHAAVAKAFNKGLVSPD